MKDFEVSVFSEHVSSEKKKKKTKTILISTNQLNLEVPAILRIINFVKIVQCFDFQPSLFDHNGSFSWLFTHENGFFMA